VARFTPNARIRSIDLLALDARHSLDDLRNVAAARNWRLT
jgi:hypothetical protein